MRITLSANEYKVIPEGRHMFKIVECKYEPRMGQIVVKLLTEDGLPDTETYNISTNGVTNEKALRAFSYFARTALNDFNVDDIDPDELVGKFIDANVKHDVRPKKDDPSKNVTFVNLEDIKPCTGFISNSISGGEKPAENKDEDDPFADWNL